MAYDPVNDVLVIIGDSPIELMSDSTPIILQSSGEEFTELVNFDSVMLPSYDANISVVEFDEVVYNVDVASDTDLAFFENDPLVSITTDIVRVASFTPELTGFNSDASITTFEFNTEVIQYSADNLNQLVVPQTALVDDVKIIMVGVDKSYLYYQYWS